MAEQDIPTPSPALQNLKEHLTCPVCLSQFNSPKTLPCLHSFCLKCIQKLTVDQDKEKGQVISCPTCRETAQVPDKGPADLPTAFLINSFIEIQDQLKKISGSEQISCDNCKEGNATKYCKQCATGLCRKCLAMHNGLKVISEAKHQIIDMKDVVSTASQLLPVKQEVTLTCITHNKSRKIFCEKCQELICRDCTIRSHRDHNYDLVTDTFPKHRKDIENILGGILDKVLAMQNALKVLATREENITKQRDDRIKEIYCLIESVIESVKQSGDELVAKVTKIAEYKLQLLGQQKEEAETALAQLQRCKEFVQKGLEVGSPQQILSEKQNLIEGMAVTSKQINPDAFQPVEEANITLIESKIAVESCKNLGTVEFSFSPIKSDVALSVPPMSGKKAVATLSLQTKLGSPYKISPSLPLACHLMSADFSRAIVCDIEETNLEAGKYSVSFTPSVHGTHQLQLNAEGIDINGSPFSLHVVPSPEMKNDPIKIIPELEFPEGIAVDKNGQLIVVEQKHQRIVVFDKEGTAVQSIGSHGTEEGHFILPRGIAITNNGQILVADNHRLQKLSPEGCYINSVGGKEGKGQLQFDGLRSIAVHPSTEQIYIADFGNHRIQVINDDFTYSHSFGSYGTAPGQLNCPHGVALDSVGNVYVISWNLHCVDVFTSDGKYTRQFGSKGSGDGQLSFPSSIAIDGHDIVYVAEWDNSRVSVFTSEGMFMRHIGSGMLKNPCGITVDTLSNLYISDSNNNRVVIL